MHSKILPSRCAMVSLLLIASPLFANPEIIERPFEPPASQFFLPTDKFAHPPEIKSPVFLFPGTMLRNAVDGETVLLVQIGEKGEPVRISVLSSTDDRFIPAAITAISRAKWDANRGACAFYYKALYRVEEFRNGRVRVGSDGRVKPIELP